MFASAVLVGWFAKAWVEIRLLLGEEEFRTEDFDVVILEMGLDTDGGAEEVEPGWVASW